MRRRLTYTRALARREARGAKGDDSVMKSLLQLQYASQCPWRRVEIRLEVLDRGPMLRCQATEERGQIARAARSIRLEAVQASRPKR